MAEDKLIRRYTLSKTEILRNKKQIRELFDNGSSFFLYPFKFFYVINSGETENQVLFSVSKKNFKTAVKRNWIRRRLKESYRLNKFELIDRLYNKISISLAIVYIEKELMEFDQMKPRMKKALHQLSKQVNKNFNEKHNEKGKD